MTLLVIDLHVPAAAAVRTEHDLWRALVALSPRLVVYLMSFLIGQDEDALGYYGRRYAKVFNLEYPKAK